MRLSSVRLITLVAISSLVAAVTASSAAASPVLSGNPAAVSPTATNWGQDGFNKGNTGYNAFETAITQANVASLNYRWSIVSPIVRNSCTQQQPPIVDSGRLFITDQGGFGAYNATTGAALWNVRDPNADTDITASLAASGSTIIAVVTDCISQSDPPSTMTAYNAATGAVLWKVNSDPAIFTIVIDNGLVITSGAPAEGPETAAYKLTDGSQVWSNDVAAAEVALSAGGRMLLENFDGSGSTAINDATGATLWTTPQNWEAFAASTDGTKFLVHSGANGDVSYVNAATGAVLWTATGLNAECGPLIGCGFAAVDTTHVYVSGCCAANETLTALNLSNGSVAWHYSDFTSIGRPIVADGIVYLPEAGTTMAVLKASTGAAINGGTPCEDEVGHAVVVNGWLYVTNGRVMDAFSA